MPKKKILIVEDDRAIAEYVEALLGLNNYTTQIALNGRDAVDKARAFFPDLILLDIMLPKLDGLSLIKHIRSNGITTPVIILSAKRTVEDRVRGLETGSDDYLIKPFSFSELLARINALIRRNSHISEPTRLQVEDLLLDLITRDVRRGDRVIELQPKEFALLEYLMRNTGRVVSKTMILEHVWDYNFDPQTNVVDVMIWRLRNKIDRDSDIKLIQTIRGVGYVLKKA
jgi:DNA-binding response OmpR family regulator